MLVLGLYTCTQKSDLAHFSTPSKLRLDYNVLKLKMLKTEIMIYLFSGEEPGYRK